jgi:hypothetical protein
MSFSVTALDVETVENVFFLIWFEESCFVWEVDKEERCEKTNCDSNNTFENEDPSPSSVSSDSVHFGNCIGKN